MLPGILEQTHEWVSERLPTGGTAVDATMGNGHDLRFLADHVGNAGRVFGFDIQEEAVTRSRLRLEKESLAHRVVLFHDSHEKMKHHLYSQGVLHIDAAMFNLGYLPHGDPAITTQPEATLDAMRQAAEMLHPGGILTAVLYTGHPGGQTEADRVLMWLEELDPKQYQTVRYQILNREHAPLLTAVCKR
ncbi:class I SAM-dependent methyltransferase [Desmospora profundinema]|uniref:Methyltransferase n=1 Tax=Desmospora profundinema TaxID=1571184 RepID=A0ABU1IN04_9BACL|nr:class I SAM-dependent methyltransferase [Desmospora profundinema]MDR6225937.1 putative methyltransferase [Desmospora profundinema]